MTKEEINSLKESQETIDKLFKFTSTSILTDEVLLASYRLATILYNDYHYEEVVKLLINKLTYYEHQKENELYFAFLTLITNSYLMLKDKKNSSYYIDLKKEATPFLKQALFYHDVLLYKNTFNEDPFPVLSQIIDKPFEHADFYSFYLEAFKKLLKENNDQLDPFYNKLLNINLNDEQKAEIESLYIEYLYSIRNLEKLEELIENKPAHIKNYFKTLMLVEEGLLIKVQLFEADHEKEYQLLTPTQQKHLFTKLRDFYFDKDKLSYDLYKEKLKSIKEIKVDNQQEKQQPQKYIIPKKLKAVKIEELLEEEHLITQDKDLKVLDAIINELLLLKTEVSLFDKIRSLSIVLETHLSFSDILYNFNGVVYHYKKERLYEKKYDSHTLDASVLGISAKEYVDIIEKVEDIKYNYDLLNNKPLTETNIKQVYCYGLVNKSSVCFYQTRTKGIHLDRELFKVISNFIAYEIQYYNKLKLYNEDHKMTEAFFNNKELVQFTFKNKLIGSHRFNEIFKLTKYDDVDSLITKFLPNEQREFQKQYTLLRRREIKNFNVEVTFNKQNYLLTCYISDGYFSGVFIDITDYKNEIVKWQEKAFINPLSNVLTLYEFEVSFPNFINDKNTFFLVELDGLQEVESLYGKLVKQQYFLEFINLIKTHFDLLYQYDSNTLLGVVYKNDIRGILKVINDFYKKIDNYQPQVLEAAKFKSFMGIIRYPIQTKETNIFKIYQYLSLSLLKAKQTKDSLRYHFFNFDDYQQDAFETEILRQIDRLIVDGKLLLSFNQIVNQKTNKVYAYQIGVYSESLSVYESYYYKLAQKRGLLPKLEKYIIQQTFIKISKLNEKVNNYIKVIINISEETLNDKDFLIYLISLFKTYKIPTNIVEFVYTGQYSQTNAQLLQKLFEHNINVGVTTIDYLYLPFVKSYHFMQIIKPLSAKLQSFLKVMNLYTREEEIIFVVYNVDTEIEKNQLRNLEIDYIRGKIVDKKFSFDELLYLIEATLKKL